MPRLLPLLVVPLIVLTTPVLLLGGGPCTEADDLSNVARGEIPSNMARVYLATARRWNIDAAFLAAISAQETDHGRNPGANEVNSSGCQGIMQLGVGGACGNFWDRWRCDGNNDGHTRILDPWDNVCAAARGLRHEKGAPPTGGAHTAYFHAACNYYGACSDANSNYAPEVMARAHRYGLRDGSATNPDAFAENVSGINPSCASAAIPDGNGKLVVDPGANRPGTSLTPGLVTYAQHMADRLRRPLTITTGTNHSPTTTSGNPSDHWDGYAADFGSTRNGFPSTGGGYGDAIAEAALLVAGEPPGAARRKARDGGAFTLSRKGFRIQIIWKTFVGGNHYDHVHVGLQPMG